MTISPFPFSKNKCAKYLIYHNLKDCSLQGEACKYTSRRKGLVCLQHGVGQPGLSNQNQYFAMKKFIARSICKKGLSFENRTLQTVFRTFD
jgi:hypothetical protein